MTAKLGLVILITFSLIAPSASLSVGSSTHDSEGRRQQPGAPPRVTCERTSVKWHLIDTPRVPYVGQTLDGYCGQACMAMLIDHCGYNASLGEILHNLGYGYSLGYNRILPPYTRVPYSGFFFVDEQFLAGLYNLTYHDYTVYGNQSGQLLWEQYWTRVKELVSNDIPVQTRVDIYSLPYWRQKLNVTDNETHGGHAIVIVGFNESNGTVCYNDPATALLGEQQNGTYVFENISTLATAVKHAQTSGVYAMYCYEKSASFVPSEHQERFEKAHRQNMGRLQGEGYLIWGTNISGLPPVYRVMLSLLFPLGMQAVKAIETDLHAGFAHRWMTVSRYSQYEPTVLSTLYEMVSTDKYNVSQYLLKNSHISPACQHDGALLLQESRLWQNLSVLVQEIAAVGSNHSLVKTMLLLTPVLKEINQVIDDILVIEKKLLNG